MGAAGEGGGEELGWGGQVWAGGDSTAFLLGFMSLVFVPASFLLLF